MNVLLIGNKFFGYTDRVANVMRDNHNVDLIYVFQRNTFQRLRFKVGIDLKEAESYYEKQILKIEGKTYDRIVVFGGGIPAYFIKSLKLAQQQAKYILYLSADISSYKFTKDYLYLFDVCYSYSLNDSNIFGLTYRPWFYSEYNTKSSKDLDLSFVGTIHPSRLKILTFLYKESSVSKYFYIYSDKLSYVRSFFKWNVLRKSIHFKSLGYEDYLSLLARSISTLDIPAHGQKNITTRPIEALATSTKIITTNKSIEHYDFYDKNNIFIWYENSSISDLKKWLEKPYKVVSLDILKKYQIKEWVNEILQ